MNGVKQPTVTSPFDCLICKNYVGIEAVLATNSILQMISNRNACQYLILLRPNNSGIVVFHNHCKTAATMNKATKTNIIIMSGSI